MRTIDLNADVGESFGRWTLGDDAALVRQVSSVNVACGFHAGDPRGLRATVRLAADAGVSVGAHPSYPDLRGFGRRHLDMDPGELEADLIYQLGALAAIARAEGVALAHVKPHGALYARVMRDPDVARTLFRALRGFRPETHQPDPFQPEIPVLLAAGSTAERIARDEGVPYAREAFADRGYASDGHLLARDRPGGVLRDRDAVVAQALRLARDGVAIADDGRAIRLDPDSICLHGDTPGASEAASAVRAAFRTAGIAVDRFVARRS